MALRWLVSPRNVGLSGSGDTYAVSGNDTTSGITGNITRLAGTVGLGLKQAEALPGFGRHEAGITHDTGAAGDDDNHCHTGTDDVQRL